MRLERELEETTPLGFVCLLLKTKYFNDSTHFTD